MRALLALSVALGFSACAAPAPQNPGRYRVVAYDLVLPLRFARDGTGLADADRRQLDQLGRELPQTVLPDVYAVAGGLAPARVAAVTAALQRPARWIVDGQADPASVVLVIRAPEQIVPDACRGPGLRLPGTIWPGSENTAPFIMPPGCAVATSIAAQATNPADLLAGQPLPPGAALPYAAAIERYYHRNDQTAPASVAVPPGAATTDGGVAPLTGEPARSGGGSLQNPLLGPLPPREAGGAAAP